MWSLDLLGEYTLFLTILTMVDFSGDIIQHHPKKTWIDVQQGASFMGVEDNLGDGIHVEHIGTVQKLKILVLPSGKRLHNYGTSRTSPSFFGG